MYGERSNWYLSLAFHLAGVLSALDSLDYFGSHRGEERSMMLLPIAYIFLSGCLGILINQTQH